MSKNYHIHIPVKPYIQKFFHPPDGSPIQPKYHPILWLTILPYLEYKVKDSLSNKQRDQQISNLKGRLTILVKKSKVRLYGIRPKDSSIVVVNKLLDYLFGKELYWYVIKCEQNPGRYKGFYRTIEEFCKIHSIEVEEDISKESLLNLYKRHRQREFLIISSKKVSRPSAA